MGEIMIEKYINLAYKEAFKAYKLGEIPVGAVIVKNEKIISKAHNLIEIKKDSTKHAEIIAIQKASKKLNNWRLDGCEMYVTLMPCDMCKGAINNSRINTIYYCIDRKNVIIQKQYIKVDNILLNSKILNMMKAIFKR